MKILVFANDKAWNELTAGSEAIEWIRAENMEAFTTRDGIDAYFNLQENAAGLNYSFTNKPVFINSVSATLQKMNLPDNITRINGWSGFIKRNSWEVAGKLNDDTVSVMGSIGKNAIHVPDEPGFIAARIIAMIINEAYFAKQENVSTETEIDIAMKLGTNYPYGPFEWTGIIGAKNVYELLQTLSVNDSRYRPALLLEQELMKDR